jgi:hypothetical protein
MSRSVDPCGDGRNVRNGRVLRVTSVVLFLEEFGRELSLLRIE